MLALLVLSPPGSQAQRRGGPPVTTPPVTTPPRVSVPEPDTNILLLLGIGVTGLVGYCLERRKRRA
jgi:hypothetical protein